MEHLQEHEQVPTWDAGSASSGFIHYTTMLSSFLFFTYRFYFLFIYLLIWKMERKRKNFSCTSLPSKWQHHPGLGQIEARSQEFIQVPQWESRSPGT